MTSATVDNSNAVAILDAGAQYSKVIDRKVRELKVRSDIIPLETPYEKIASYKAVIISGGPGSVYEKDAPRCDAKLLDSGMPILGICYGMQLINLHNSGTVEKKSEREDGQGEVSVETDSVIFKGMKDRQQVLLTHGDSVGKVADNFRVISKSGDIVTGIECKDSDKKLWGLQFHPEVDLSINGKQMISNFLFEAAKLEPSFTASCRQSSCIKEILETVGDKKKVLCLVSGGVDSSVCAALLTKAIGPERVIALHLDNGFMRKEESKLVEESLEHLGLHLRVVDASEEFYNATTLIDGKETKKLKETVSPEEKRKIIGDTFMKVAEKEIAALKLNPENVFLAQGTLRPDLIESASAHVSKKASAIKTHHNDTALVRLLRDQGKVIEPLKDYHKDEVRELGIELGLPPHLVQRQPFPGPGLAVRTLCVEEPYICNDFEKFNQQLKNMVAGKDTAFNTAMGTENIAEMGIKITLLPIKTVGVQGDGRTYSYVAAVTCDYQTLYEVNWEKFMKLAKVIPRLCHVINRVVFVFGKIGEHDIRAITPTHLTTDTLSQLKEADFIVNKILYENNLTISLSQVPVISAPIDFDHLSNSPSEKRSICIRTFITNDFMTGVPAIPGKDIGIDALTEMAQLVGKCDRISRVIYDMTAKPPGTTEWE